MCCFCGTHRLPRAGVALAGVCGSYRLPRAGIDPIDTAALAGAMIAQVAAHPPRSETIALLLDRRRRGISVLVVSDTVEADAMFDVLDVIVAAAIDRASVPAGGGAAGFGGVVLASVRPGGATEPGDLDRWLEASDLLAGHDAELVEWFVIGTDVVCPRDLLGEPPRWRP